MTVEKKEKGKTWGESIGKKKEDEGDLQITFFNFYYFLIKLN